jgi:phosphohistidine phosphatase
MKTLLILRHAKSSWKHAELADIDRPLNKRGQRQSPEMGRLVREENLTPDLILSSPAARARTTAEVVAQESGYEEVVELEPQFYPGAPEDYLRVLRRVPEPARSVMVVGHNPGLEELLEALTGQAEPLPTAALAQVLLPVQSWRELSSATRGQLVNLWTPRQ